MNKNCQPSPAIQKRRPEAKRPANKVGKLEEKLDGLVALLKSTTSSTPKHPEIALINPTTSHSPGTSAAWGTRYGGHNSPPDW